MNSNKIFCDNNYTIEYTESVHTANDTRPVYKTIVEKEKRIKNHWESQAQTVNIGGIEINAEKHIIDETEKNIRAIEKKMSFTYKNLFNGIFGILIAMYIFLYGIGTYINYENIGFLNITETYNFVIESNEIQNDNLRKRASFFARTLAKKTNETIPNAIYTHELVNSKTEYIDSFFRTNIELKTKITINNEEKIIVTSYVINNELTSKRFFGLVKYSWNTKIINKSE